MAYFSHVALTLGKADRAARVLRKNSTAFFTISITSLPFLSPSFSLFRSFKKKFSLSSQSNMYFATSSFVSSLPVSNLTILQHAPSSRKLRQETKETRSLSCNSLQCFHAHDQVLPKAVITDEILAMASNLPSCKLQGLISEFRALREPINRVKRLLHYASILPPMDESCKVALNRVIGCTAEVWLEVKMDGLGRMRFRADSDSEITKGFCYCLISALDGAMPEEVLDVGMDDLGVMNVGVGMFGKVNSRVNTWLNILIRMQKRTNALVEERNNNVLQSLAKGQACNEKSMYMLETKET